MAQAATAGASPPEQFVDVLTLALAGQFDQAQFGELGDLGPGRVVAHRLGEVLKQLQLVAARLHVDEVDDHNPTDVAQLQLAGNLNRRLTVGPQHRFARVRRTGEGARVDVDDGERLGGLDDHVTARRQIHPGFKGIANRGMHPEMVEDLGVVAVVLHQQVGLVSAEERIHPAHGLGRVDDNAHHLRVIEIAQHPVDEILIAVQQHRRAGRFRRLLNRLPLAQEHLQVIDQQLFAHRLGLGADQQPGARGLDQHAEGAQAVAFVFAVDAARDRHPLAVGLQHQKPARQAEVARQAGALGARGLLHHLHQHLLARFEQFGDASGPFPQAQGA